MIVPMKKVSVLVMDKERESALQKIRELGILHLNNKVVTSPALTKLMDRHAQIEIALHVLDSFPHKKGSKIEQTTYSEDVVDHVLELYDKQKTIQDYIFYQQRERENLKRWGDFNPASFQYLADNGVKAYLYELSPNSYKENVGDVPVIVLSRDKKNKLILLIAFDEIPNETSLPVPKRCISEVNVRSEIRRSELVEIEAELVDLWRFKEQLDSEKLSILADIEFETVRAGMNLIDEETEWKNQDTDVAVSWVSGYVPTPELKLLQKAAAENGWALCAEDPAEDDLQVPTKLKNNRVVSLIYPLTKFLEIHPSYRETDISWLLLIFFTLFFGMLFGDAGYGSVLAIIAGIGIAVNFKKGVPLFFQFLLLMSASAITWGILTCAWFGVDIAKVPMFLQSISLPLIANIPPDPALLASYNANNLWISSGLIKPHQGLTELINANLMFFCFSIALIHLGIARIKRIIMYIRSLKVLGEIGAFAMLFCMLFVVLSLVVYKTGFPGVKPWQLYSILGGFSLVFVFGKYEGSILKSFLESCSSFISIVLGIANVFSDIMSYIRLWAVGVAGASLAATINAGAGTMLSSFIFFIFGVALLLFGHTFNITLNVLAVLVHGVRLNTLEFSSNLGLSWAGFEYKPFAKR